MTKRQSRRTSKSPKLLGQIFGNHWIEELATGYFGGGDEPGDSCASPRRDDLDVEPRLRPFLAIGRALIQPHHVGQWLVVQPVEPIEDVDEECSERIASGVVERRKIGDLVSRRKRQRDRERRCLRHTRVPHCNVPATAGLRFGDEPLAAVRLRLPARAQQ
jgi:hypothetical protein